MKKAEASQIFIYAISLILVGLVMLFGYKVIGSIMQVQTSMEKIAFVNEFTTYLEKGTNSGDFDTKHYTIPEKYKQVCFVADNPPPNCAESQCLQDLNPLVRNQWLKYGAKNNVFLVTGVNEFYSFRVKRTLHLDMDANGVEGQEKDLKTNDTFNPENSYLCVDVKGQKLTLAIEDKGHYFFLSTNTQNIYE